MSYIEVKKWALTLDASIEILKLFSLLLIKPETVGERSLIPTLAGLIFECLLDKGKEVSAHSSCFNWNFKIQREEKKLKCNNASNCGKMELDMMQL